jgi:hypothetical protein
MMGTTYLGRRGQRFGFEGLHDSVSLLARKEAWVEGYRRTPHGKPVELAAGSDRGRPAR